MIKINCKDEFDFWYGNTSNKKFIMPNDGIGDLIICANFAKYTGMGVLHFTQNDYRYEFSKEFCQLINVPYFYIYNIDNIKKNNMIKNLKYNKILQFDIMKYFPEQEKNIIMQKIFMQDHGLKKEKSNNQNKTAFICPNGSHSTTNIVKRSMEKNQLNYIIKKLKEKNFDIYIVGVEKDMNIYNHLSDCKWINTKFIIDSNNKKTDICMRTFFEMVSVADLSITVPTSFHCISNMLGVKTLTIHRFNMQNIPLINRNDNYSNFFANNQWYKNGTNVSYPEVYEYIENI
jgi:hypothetical protein